MSGHTPRAAHFIDQAASSATRRNTALRTFGELRVACGTILVVLVVFTKEIPQSIKSKVKVSHNFIDLSSCILASHMSFWNNAEWKLICQNIFDDAIGSEYRRDAPYIKLIVPIHLCSISMKHKPNQLGRAVAVASQGGM